VTEHLVVAAGSYACQWKYGEQVVSGMLELEASKPPAAEVFDAPGTLTTDGNLRIFEPHGDDLAQLRGWTRRGDAAALLGARVEHFPDGRSFVKAQTALVGDDIPEDMLFGSVEFQVGGLTEISGIRPLSKSRYPATWTVTLRQARSGTVTRPRRNGSLQGAIQPGCGSSRPSSGSSTTVSRSPPHLSYSFSGNHGQ
jgi:hypothetical protein